MATILVSIKPLYLQKILDGSKRFELRKRSGGISGGDRMFLYGTRPVHAILATCVVRQVVADSPNRVYRVVNGSAGIGRRQFSEYFSGHSVAYAIELASVEQLNVPVLLSEMRERIPGFVVPRSYRFMTKEEIAEMERACLSPLI